MTTTTTRTAQQSWPILDMETFHVDRAAFVQAFRKACTGTGFFYLRHRIPSTVVQAMLQETRTFFEDACAADKHRISYEHNPALRGYMALGVENTAGRIDQREQIEYATEYPIDYYPTSDDDDNNNNNDTDRPLYERLRARRNPWPDDVQPTLEPVTRTYVQHLQSIANVLHQTYSLALGLPADALDDMMFASDENSFPRQHPPHWVIKLLSYPSMASATTTTTTSTFADDNDNNITDDDDDDESWGVGPHIDTNFFTLILTDQPGLQAFVEGSWRDVPIAPRHDDNNETSSDTTNQQEKLSSSANHHYLIVNLGEQAQALSHGVLRATPHRVLPHCGKGRRTSLAFFTNPPLQTRLLEEPVETLRNAPSWREKRSNRILGTVGENVLKSLARSHPRVFQRHHPDVQVFSDGRLVVIQP